MAEVNIPDKAWAEYEAWDAAGSPGEETWIGKAWEDVDVNDLMGDDT